ncbi:MAG: branched-chain amino acid transporter permease [Frankiales bacterium]|nr:branched-chain amino acid transporter permease [Frankiales bacterium]
MSFFLEAVIQGVFIGAVYAVITFGLAVLHSVSGVLNFAHGNFVVLSMFLCLILHEHLNLDPYVAGIIVTPVMFVVGAALYKLVFARLATASTLTVIQATLGMMFIIEAGLLMTQGGQFKRIPSMVDNHDVAFGGLRIGMDEIVAFLGALLLTGILFWVLEHSVFGRSVRAVQQNGRAAQLVGVNTERIRVLSFGLGIALAAVAGVLLVPGNSIHPSQGLNYTVIAIMAFFIGGMGSYIGTLLGAVALGLAESLGAVYLPGSIGFALPYLIVVLVILLRPNGLFRRSAAA